LANLGVTAHDKEPWDSNESFCKCYQGQVSLGHEWGAFPLQQQSWMFG
jgi:hypothetical protein